MTRRGQIIHAFWIGIVTTLARPRHALLTACGLLIAGMTLLVLLTIPAGLDRLAGQTGLAGVAMVLPEGSLTESDSFIQPTSPPTAKLIGTLPGVAHTPDGQPIVAAQYVLATRLQRVNGSTATVVLRGVTPMFWKIVAPSIRVRSGSRPRSSVDQLMAGAAAARTLAGIGIGDTIAIHRTPWVVSGEFTAGGGFWGSQLWTSMAALQGAMNAQGTVSSIWVKLTSPSAFDRFVRAVRADPRLNLVTVVASAAITPGRPGFLT